MPWVSVSFLKHAVCSEIGGAWYTIGEKLTFMGPYLNNAVKANEIKVTQVAVNWREHRNHNLDTLTHALPKISQ